MCNGAYLEWHDNPHFQMPIKREGLGEYLILGKMIGANNTLHIGGFEIPYGKAVYMRPYIHYIMTAF